MKAKYQIIYEDGSLVVVNKAPGVLSIPDRYKPELFNLYNHLYDRFGKIFTVHRLDRETSGILVYAKTEDAHKSLSQQFERRTTRKIYYALVEGVMEEGEGTIEKAIAPHPTQAKMIVSSHGKPSVTHYEVVKRYGHHTLAEVNIETGRTHQIRVHFQSIGHPLAVDKLYGRQDGFYLSGIKGKKYRLGKGQEERPLMSRTSLHAFRLSFDHPEKAERVSFEAELPRDFAAVIKQLDKWDS